MGSSIATACIPCTRCGLKLVIVTLCSLLTIVRWRDSLKRLQWLCGVVKTGRKDLWNLFVRVLIEWKGWEFLRLRIVSLSRRLGNRWWSRALLAKTCLLKNLAISVSRICFSESTAATINARTASFINYEVQYAQLRLPAGNWTFIPHIGRVGPRLLTVAL